MLGRRGNNGEGRDARWGDAAARMRGSFMRRREREGCRGCLQVTSGHPLKLYGKLVDLRLRACGSLRGGLKLVTMKY